MLMFSYHGEFCNVRCDYLSRCNGHGLCDKYK